MCNNEKIKYSKNQYYSIYFDIFVEIIIFIFIQLDIMIS